MILGIGYSRICPEVICTLPSGLQVLKSRFLPAKRGEESCLGRPLGAVSSIVNHIGAQSTMHYLSHVMSKYDNYNSKVDFFQAVSSHCGN